MTIDEELSLLDENVRRLKIEYDVYFGGGSKKPPADTEWRVQSVLRKYGDGSRMNFAQRFRFNSIQQKYALFSALWQQKLKIKEEGYRRPQDAVLGIQGLRPEEHPPSHATTEDKPFSIDCADADRELAKIETLFNALADARRKAGDNTVGSMDSFKNFVRQKTAQIRKDFGCGAVEYCVELKDGQVRLKARPKAST
ncbi:MAG TPA: MXAN_5187 C-terminal domain-containing protein [Candidatus Angelobacter sp.]|nr:MXAN_5187 C-terminal domain-containing protein [Candidatus Angelobacter sp.]